MPASAAPTNTDEALAAATEVGYPVVLKPRTHAGVGLRRGAVVNTADVLASTFRPWPIRPGNDSVLAVDPDVALPLVQHYYELGTADVISVTGYLDRDRRAGRRWATPARSRSRRAGSVWGRCSNRWPRRRSPTLPSTSSGRSRAPGSSSSRCSSSGRPGAYVALDLNPRAFGQMSLDIGRGNDLPLLWYNDVAGTSLRSATRRRRSAELWHDAIGSYVGFAVRFLRGPRRVGIARHAWGRIVAPTVGAMHDWGDPLPGFRFVAHHLRHPRAFMRPYLVDSELQGTDGRPQVLEDPGHGPPP